MTKTTRRHDALKQMLLEHRRELHQDLLGRVRDGRIGQADEGRDLLEVSDAATQGDLALALLQMRSDTLSRIDAALVRLRAGGYGTCVVCAGDIAETRLRVLPFAVRCRACEEKHEVRFESARRSPEYGRSPQLSLDALATDS